MENFDSLSNDKALLPPGLITMERMHDLDSVLISQATSQFCRCCCTQPSMNFTIVEGKTNVSPNDQIRQQELGEVGAWVAEEASFWGRCLSACVPGARSTKWSVHSGPIPPALRKDETNCFDPCSIQWAKHSKEFEGVSPDVLGEIINTHEKEWTNGVTAGLGDKRCPCCTNLPYLISKDKNGRQIGKTQYVCDWCLFVPKFDIFDGNDRKRYRLRPDTCCLGFCIRPRFGGNGGKCCRVPFLLRDPDTFEPVATNSNSVDYGDNKAQITSLWTGVKRCCERKNAYAVHFPSEADADMKSTLIGASLLLDMAIFEQEE